MVPLVNPELYYQILAIEGHHTKYKVLIENNSGTKIEYSGSNLVSLSLSSRLFTDDSFSVGGVGSSKIEMEIIPTTETIKKMAEIDVYARLESGNLVSEWVPQGVYFIYTREHLQTTETLNAQEGLKIVAYDAMLKADTFVLEVDQSLSGWPKKMNTLVSEICSYMGVQLDSGTVISSDLECEADYSMTRRDYLSEIAKAHAGNWVIDYTGKLKLVNVFNEYNLLATENYIPITFGGTRILV